MLFKIFLPPAQCFLECLGSTCPFWDWGIDDEAWSKGLALGKEKREQI